MHFTPRKEGYEYFIDAWHGWKFLGHLSYVIDSPYPIYLAEIDVPLEKDWRKGIGSALVRKFVADVGPDKDMYALVANLPSYKKMEEMGIFGRVGRRTDLILIGPQEMFRQIPIARVLINGGISIQSMILESKVPDELPVRDLRDLFTCTIRGKTT